MNTWRLLEELQTSVEPQQGLAWVPHLHRLPTITMLTLGLLGLSQLTLKPVLPQQKTNITHQTVKHLLTSNKHLTLSNPLKSCMITDKEIIDYKGKQSSSDWVIHL